MAGLSPGAVEHRLEFHWHLKFCYWDLALMTKQHVFLPVYHRERVQPSPRQANSQGLLAPEKVQRPPPPKEIAQKACWLSSHLQTPWIPVRLREEDKCRPREEEEKKKKKEIWQNSCQPEGEVAKTL